MSVQIGVGSNAGKQLNYFNVDIKIAGGPLRIRQQNPTNQGKSVDVPEDFHVNYVQITNSNGNNNVKVNFKFQSGKTATASVGNQVTGLNETIKGATADAVN